MTAVIRDVRCATRGCSDRSLADDDYCRTCQATGARAHADNLPKALLWLNLNRLEHLTPQPGWERNGACYKTGNTAAFYPEPTDDATKKKAKARCARCPARYACLAIGLTQTGSDDHGIWGGTTRCERRVIRRALNARNVA